MNWTFPVGCFIGSLVGTAITIWIKNQEIKMIRENYEEKIQVKKDLDAEDVKDGGKR